MNEDYEILTSDLLSIFTFGSKKQKYQVSTVICYMMLLLKYDLITLSRESEECK